MGNKWQYFFFKLWFGLALVLALALFLNGFLLNKTSLRDTSKCTNVSVDLTCKESDGICSNRLNVNDSKQMCLSQKAKVILVLIDAFRYDFALYNESIDEEYYLNKMPIISKILNTKPDNTRLYKFVADPPTTTMQRLKALTTGTLPTFIDAGSNFATPEINEDNIIDEAVQHTKKVVFLGDDTWQGLYPNRFLRSYPFPSFNVHDLDTVDDGINENIFNELKKKDWDLLIAHYLGVDHCGHRYGPVHSEMARKLMEMNEVISNIIKELDDNTVLFVVGDHGMTMTGDHGGESKEETTAAMFVHSNMKLINKQSDENGDDSDEVMQIDLVPTISTILGIPIPYSSIGFVIIDTLPAKYDITTLLHVIYNNLQQMLMYIKHYSLMFDIFDAAVIEDQEAKFGELHTKLATVTNNYEFDEFLIEVKKFSNEIREMCKKQWTQFNSLDMIRGLLNFFVTVFFTFILVDGIKSENFHQVFTAKYLAITWIVIALPFVIYTILSSNSKYYASYSALTCFFCCFGSTAMFATLVGINWVKIPEQWYESSKRRKWIDQASRCVLMISVCGLFSNSFIVEESLLLLYLWFSLVTFVIIDLNLPFKKNYRRKITKIRIFAASIVVFLALRYSYYFVRCREEQQWCYGKDYFERFSGNSLYLVLLNILVMIILVVIVRLLLKRSGNLTGYSSTVILANTMPTVMVVLMSTYWIMQSSQGNAKQLFDPWKLDAIAWTLYMVFALSVLSVILQPLLIDIKIKKQFSPTLSSHKLIPQLFKEIKTRLNDKTETENVPVICGLGTVYGSVYGLIGLYFGLIWAFVLGGTQSLPVAIMFLLMCFVLFLSSITRYEKASCLSEIANVPNVFIVIWSLLANFFFYSTGHQATFSNIVWDAAFIGTGGALKNVYFQGLLVILNTFGSHILTGLTLPLLLIAPFTLQFIKTELRPKRIDVNDDLLRGDIVLYENERWLFNNASVLCCKYILVSALRVFFSMITATIHCRHLMVWSIFAPKLIFEGVALIVTILSVIVGYLILILVTNKLSNLFDNITMKCR